MKISFKWVKQYVDIPVPPAALVDVFPQLGLEVDDYALHGFPALQQVVVGEILTRDAHPNADRLTVCQVDVGGAMPLNIVCGAKNHQIGDRVFVALPGAVLPGGLKIKKGNLRGIASEGMMCSASELGLKDQTDGLYILKDRPPVGQPIHELAADADIVYDLAITANRSDALGHLGVARDLAAYFNVPLKKPAIQSQVLTQQHSELIEQVEIQHEGVAYYALHGLRGVRVAPSPSWLQQALAAVGLRSINNIVDITNFVMMETGQPLHAFDAAAITGKKLIVRPAQPQERVATLDQKTYTLPAGAIVIADDQKPLAIAGIIGGQEAQVSEHTVDVLIESACFDAASIRLTAQHLGIATDSAYRFERGIDPEGVLYALWRALALIQEIAGGSVETGGWYSGEPLAATHTIHTSLAELEAIVGFHIDPQELKRIFERLELSVTIDGASWQVRVPGAKQEVAAAEDLAEEFLRIYGVDKIPTLATGSSLTLLPDAPIGIQTARIVQTLAALGFNECYHYSLIPEKSVSIIASDPESFKIENPLSTDQAYLRPSLIPGLLQTFEYNYHQKRDVRHLFEIGRIWLSQANGLQECVAIAGLTVQKPQKNSWKPQSMWDFYSLRDLMMALAQQVGESIHLKDWQTIEASNLWQPGHSAQAYSCRKKDAIWAQVGLLNLRLTQPIGIKGGLWGMQLVLPLAVFDALPPCFSYQPLNLYPATRKDLAIQVPEHTPSATVMAALQAMAQVATGSSFSVEAIDIFDVYKGSHLPEGQKSLAFSLDFRAKDRTLTDQEVNKALMDLQNLLKQEGYILRT